MRPVLIVAAVVRALLGAVALLLAPWLYRDHFVLLVLLRPTKEVLLAAGFFVRRGDVALGPILIAAVPLVVLGVWLFYALGAAYRAEINDADLPALAGRVLPPQRIQKLMKALDRAGVRVVVLGRLAVFPSSVMAAAAGAARMEPRRFLPADGIGAMLSVVEVLALGYLLGETYEDAGPWLTAVGTVALFVLLWLIGRKLRDVS